MRSSRRPTRPMPSAPRCSASSSAFPGGLPDWYDTPGCYFSGYSVPWMFDLLLAYHPDKLLPRRRPGSKTGSEVGAETLKFDTRNPGAPSQSGHDVVPPETREGKTMVSFPNWYSRYMGPSLACALVSGNQAAVDYWADSGWPHELLTFDGVPSPAALSVRRGQPIRPRDVPAGRLSVGCEHGHLHARRIPASQKATGTPRTTPAAAITSGRCRERCWAPRWPTTTA